jgi:hypothetical protein
MNYFTKIVLLAFAGFSTWGQAAATDWSPAQASPAATGLSGLYFMTRFWVGSGLEMATYRFQGGSVVRNPIGQDLEAERALHPADAGTFQLQGSQLVHNLAGKHTATFEVMDHGCFGWDAGIFCPVEVFPRGATLEGTFEGGASASAGGNSPIASTQITFRRDGTYDLGSAVSFSTKGSKTETSGGSTSSARGTYRIEGTAMHMTPEGGNESIVSTFPLER